MVGGAGDSGTGWRTVREARRKTRYLYSSPRRSSAASTACAGRIGACPESPYDAAATGLPLSLGAAVTRLVADPFFANALASASSPGYAHLKGEVRRYLAHVSTGSNARDRPVLDTEERRCVPPLGELTRQSVPDRRGVDPTAATGRASRCWTRPAARANHGGPGDRRRRRPGRRGGCRPAAANQERRLVCRRAAPVGTYRVWPDADLIEPAIWKKLAAWRTGQRKPSNGPGRRGVLREDFRHFAGRRAWSAPWFPSTAAATTCTRCWSRSVSRRWYCRGTSRS